MGLLESIPGQIYQGFRNKLRLGTLWRGNVAQSSGLNAQGDPIATDPMTWPCQGFTDNYNDAFRARAGIPEGDVKVCVFGASLPVVPMKDDKVNMNGQWWQLRKVSTDPAQALYTCQAFSCPEPS